MTATQAFIGIDAGTTGCTVMVFDEHGARLGQGQYEYPVSSPRAGWVEQDAQDVWHGICEASKQAVASADVPAEAYRSVGFSSQRGTFILLDEAKNPPAASIVWNDGGHRSTRDLRRVDQRGGLPDPHRHAARRCGRRRRSPGCATTSRSCSSRPAGSPTARSTSCTAWVPRRVTDPASLTLNGMMDIEKLDWSDTILALCGIGRDRLPPSAFSGQAGVVSAEASEATGIPAGVLLRRGRR